jgi:hypothetical protein
MPSRLALRSAGQVVDVCATQTDTSGGSSETGTNELAAMPAGMPSTRGLPTGQFLGDEVPGLVGAGAGLGITDHDCDAHRRLHSSASSW